MCAEDAACSGCTVPAAGSILTQLVAQRSSIVRGWAMRKGGNECSDAMSWLHAPVLEPCHIARAMCSAVKFGLLMVVEHMSCIKHVHGGMCCLTAGGRTACLGARGMACCCSGCSTAGRTRPAQVRSSCTFTSPPTAAAAAAGRPCRAYGGKRRWQQQPQGRAV
jgi:hypothetical protein